MKIVKFRLRGDYGHFKIPFTNNNPMTYSFITKTALIGLIGAVIGYERDDLRKLYPILSKSLKYSVSINNELTKIFISNYSVNFNNINKNRPNKTPKSMEYLKNVDLTVYVICDSNDDAINGIFDNFVYNIQNDIYIWKPTLGIKQCTCEIENIVTGDCILKNGIFKTKTFICKHSEWPENVDIYKERIPTHQDDNWFNDPKLDVNVYFTDNGNEIIGDGEYYSFNDQNLFAV